MSRLTDALDLLAREAYTTQWKPTAWKQYVLTGDKKHLSKVQLVVFGRRTGLRAELLETLGNPDEIDTEGKRFLEALMAAGHWSGLTSWLATSIREAPRRDDFEAACKLLADLGCPPTRLVLMTASGVRPLEWEDGTLTSAGRLLTTAPQRDLQEWLALPDKWQPEIKDVSGLLAAHAPDQLAATLGRLKPADVAAHLGTSFWCRVLERNARAFADPAVQGLTTLKDRSDRFEVLARLAAFDPRTHGRAAESLGVELLLERQKDEGFTLWCDARDAGVWLAAHATEAAFAALKTYFAAPLNKDKWTRESQAEYKSEVLDAAAKALGAHAVPLYEACFETDQAEVQLHALRLWTALSPQPDPERLLASIRRGLQASDAGGLARVVRLLTGEHAAAVEADLWPLLAHKSRPVRDAAAAALAKLGDSRLAHAAGLWQAKRADTRIAAAAWLQGVGTPAALRELASRLESEADDDVRDALLLGIEKLAGGTGELKPAEMKRRIRETVAKLDGPPVKWLDPKKLPAPKLKSGERLGADGLLYLLHRQSRVKEMRPDVEARPLFQSLDRSTSGDLGLAAANAFLGSKIEADHRWVLAFSALVGDDRLVPLLTRQIREWADAGRGKLAEYAVQALALLGSEAALLAVDTLAIRYRSKYKNIGKAATEAFADAARTRGLTPEELGDVVVPWLGFTPGQPRIVDTAKARIEVRIGADLKLALRDTGTNKRLPKLPDSAPAAVKAELKELAASLKEAAKSQTLRLENLMVRQFRWPVARWRDLFLSHPLLLPFSQRLVWAACSLDGQLTTPFRALEDGSLTTATDEPLACPAAGSVGIAHPLELGEARAQAWTRHLADYDITPPFPQLDRPVVRVKPEDRERKFGDLVAGTEINGMTFRGRAERLGWSRGSVCDAGGINFYLKTFPTAGVDVFVGTDGLFIGMDMYDDIKLGQVFFVKTGSVRIGSYEYDEPGDSRDPRLVPFGDVPPIAFSEAMGDLARIAAKSAHSEDA